MSPDLFMDGQTYKGLDGVKDRNDPTGRQHMCSRWPPPGGKLEPELSGTHRNTPASGFGAPAPKIVQELQTGPRSVGCETVSKQQLTRAR